MSRLWWIGCRGICRIFIIRTEECLSEEDLLKISMMESDLLQATHLCLITRRRQLCGLCGMKSGRKSLQA
eukprot:scaffold11908_cov72-Skeletonema_dohrnii-CCMP3373.AAC.2